MVIVELVRNLILSIEKNTWFELSIYYAIMAIIIAFIIFFWRLYFSYLRPKSLNKIQRYFQKKYYKKYILLDNEKVNNYWTGKFINIFGWIFAVAEILYIALFKFWVNILAYIFNIIMIGYININLVLPVIILTILLILSMNFTSTKTLIYRKKRKEYWEDESKQSTKILMEKFTILKNNKIDEEIDKILNINKKVIKN